MARNLAVLCMQFVALLAVIAVAGAMQRHSFGWSGSAGSPPFAPYLTATICTFIGIWFRLGLDALHGKNPTWSEFLKDMIRPNMIFTSVVLSAVLVIALLSQIDPDNYVMVATVAFQTGFFFRSVMGPASK